MTTWTHIATRETERYTLCDYRRGKETVTLFVRKGATVDIKRLLASVDRRKQSQTIL